MGLFATIGLTSLLVAASGPQAIAESIEATNPPACGWEAGGGGDRLLCPGLRPDHGARGVVRRHGLPGAELARSPARPARRGGPEAGVRRRVDAGRIWTPRIFFENVLEPPRYHSEPVVEADEDGLVTSWAIVSGKFSSAMDLRRFPFDRQVLPVRIGAFEDESVLRFAVKRELVLVDEDAFVTDWTIGGPRAQRRLPSVRPRSGGLPALRVSGGRRAAVDLLHLAGDGAADLAGRRLVGGLLVRAGRAAAPDQHVHGRPDRAGGVQLRHRLRAPQGRLPDAHRPARPDRLRLRRRRGRRGHARPCRRDPRPLAGRPVDPARRPLGLPPGLRARRRAEPVSPAPPTRCRDIAPAGDLRGVGGRRATPLAGGAPMVQDEALHAVPWRGRGSGDRP